MHFCDLMNRSQFVCFPVVCRRHGSPTAWLSLTDAVEKLGDEHGARNKRIRVNGSLNRHCVRDSSFESKLLARTLKIVFQQHRPKAAIDDSELSAPSLRLPPRNEWSARSRLGPTRL